jgi:hypothetical protein
MPKKIKEDLQQKAINAALEIIGSQGFSALNFDSLAENLKCEKAELEALFIDPVDIVNSYFHHVNLRLCKDFRSPEPNLDVRERLFDIMMARFDILNDNRQAVINISKECCANPQIMFSCLPSLYQAMSFMLDYAQVPTKGCRGALKTFALGSIYLRVFKSFENDESEDLSKTMATLDNALSRAESLARSINL